MEIHKSKREICIFLRELYISLDDLHKSPEDLANGEAVPKGVEPVFIKDNKRHRWGRLS